MSQKTTSQPPGPRTFPTVKPLATMNLRNLRQWEVRFGVVHVVVLMGLITGTMACAFYLGFYSGQDVGFERAYTETLSQTPRMPISESELSPELQDQVVSEVYARLNDPAHPALDGAGKDLPLPALGAIQKSDATTSPDMGALPEVVSAEQPSNGNIPSIDADQNGIEDDAKNLAAQADTAAAKTLGALIAESSAKNLNVVGSSKVAGVKVADPKAELPAKLNEQKVVPPSAKREALKQERVVEQKQGNSFVRQVLLPGWYAQISAPRKLSEADSVATKLKSSGFDVLIENANVRGQEYFRVLVGPEDSREQAERLIGQLRRESTVRGDPFLRMVK